MNLAVIGSGGREHAICYKLILSPKIKKLICIPGNAGTQKIAENIKEDISDFNALYQIIKKHNIDLVIVGPEQPLVDGLVDYLNDKKIRVFGPDKFASQLEGSKAFMKNLCKKNDIPTANFDVFNNFNDAANFIKKNGVPIVVKADGLAAGKGVSVCTSVEEALKNTKEIFDGKFKSSNQVVLEECLKGEELSYFTIVDENSYHFFGSAQDHKRVGEGDTGPNTGGMGAYSPAPLLTQKLEEKIKKKIIEPTLNAMKKLDHSYKGFLYAGLMIYKDEPYLIEYNIRMGDPECQVLMMRLKTDLLEIIDCATKNKLNNLKIEWIKKSSITIVLCAKGYPSNYIKNSEIKNLSNVLIDKNNQIFHAGTYEKNNKTYSNGGRVLNITSSSESLIEARNKSLINIDKINWSDGFFRKDIGWRVINKK
ncbi:MAG TPA: phosphoribosylamine--glycine ligase [Pelagibacteraceae bacterium]|jgi:phosphoribosylamine--glycine ligase|nr:phosphoribosylamine--glycine ligase [Pelagibacteraceae bacterium]|tara:strand:- start:6014 stop:7282 length:1269 start_codon:yes stop_codon:yes gene_type:complete